MFETVQNFDIHIIKFIDQIVFHPLLDSLMVIFTFLGEIGWFWIVLAIILLISKKYRETGVVTGLALALSALLAELIIKNCVQRLRPFRIIEDIQLIIAAPSGFSFPSGHSSASIAAAFAICFYSKNKTLSVISLIVALLIAFSRLYLKVHFLTDVMTGIILGFVWALLASFLFNRYLKNPLENAGFLS